MANQAPKFRGFAEVQAHGRRILIKVSEETADRVIGFRVTREGEKWESVTAETVTNELVVAHPKQITKRLVLNTHFGLLEPEDGQDRPFAEAA